MIKLKLKDLNNPSFLEALRKLATTTGLSGKAAYKIGKMQQWVEKELQTASELEMKVVKEFCELDAEGNIVPRKTKHKVLEKDSEGKSVEVEKEIAVPGSFVLKPEHVESYRAKLLDMFEADISVELSKLTLDDIEKAGLTPMQINGLEGVLVPMEVVK